MLSLPGMRQEDDGGVEIIPVDRCSTHLHFGNAVVLSEFVVSCCILFVCLFVFLIFL